MTTNEAKAVSIADFLQNVGIEPKRQYGKYLYYHAPYREDKQPSFRIDTALNLWYDISANEGGKLIDLVCKMYGCTVSESLQIIDKENKPVFSFSHSQNNAPTIAVKHVQSLQNKALTQYVESRKIPFDLARKYVSEIYYNLNETNKQYFGLAFKNDLGGYEIRNKYFKGCTGQKSIKTIKNGNSIRLTIFEGFIDFLSILAYYKSDKPNVDVIILNSTSQIKQVVNILAGYEKINLFLDNDTAGENAAEFIQSKHGNAKNHSKIMYPDFKDFNEFLIIDQKRLNL